MPLFYDSIKTILLLIVITSGIVYHLPNSLLNPIQVQASIKRKMERQKRRSIEQGMLIAEGLGATHVPPQRQRSRQPPQTTAAEAAEDSEALEEQLEEMLEGRRRTSEEKEAEEDSADLLPIVNSVFGQVGLETVGVGFCEVLNVALCVFLFLCWSCIKFFSLSNVSLLT